LLEDVFQRSLGHLHSLVVELLTAFRYKTLVHMNFGLLHAVDDPQAELYDQMITLHLYYRAAKDTRVLQCILVIPAKKRSVFAGQMI